MRHVSPDKNPGVKGAHERFSRLGVISTILRNEESRKRYDFFYKNGVPKWRGASLKGADETIVLMTSI